MSKVIIVPDIHGRDFWKSVLKNKTDTIVFLGDYSDPYPDERINDDQALEELHDIVDFKERNKSRVILLLGNHDASKINNRIFYPCRESKHHVKEYQKYFRDKRNLFQIAYETKQNDVKYLFTHAGATQGWLDRSNIKTKYKSVATTLNLIWDRQLDSVTSLGDISRHRGGHAPYGSPLWADWSEHFNYSGLPKESLEGYYQIFAHTRLKQDISIDKLVTDYWAMLDCQKVFVLENNKISEYNGR